MSIFELSKDDILRLNDGELRELVARLCEAELVDQGLPSSLVHWGGAQQTRDDGVDVRVAVADGTIKPGFVPNAFTDFQVKKHSMSKAACRGEMLKNSMVRPIIADLAAKGGAYIIVSGTDDCSALMSEERLAGMQEAVTALPDKANLTLDFYGRDKLEQWLRCYPAACLWARQILGKPLSSWQPFGHWAAASEKNDDFIVADESCIFCPGDSEPQPISAGIDYLRQQLGNSKTAIRLVGLSGVGKTRLAQALFEGENALPQSRVIYADLGDDLTPLPSEVISDLIANKQSAYLILDNCSPEIHRKLQKQLASAPEGTSLSLLTIEYDISDDEPEGTQVVKLEPQGEKLVAKLILRRFSEVGQVNADRLADLAGGNARLGLALAQHIDKDEDLSRFTDNDLFNRLFWQRKGEDKDLKQSAELLSLVYSFNIALDSRELVKPIISDELEALGRIGGLSRRDLYRDQAELMRRNLAQRRGDWRAVLPHALANRLAQWALQNIPLEDINAELFKPENWRLLQSCAHRLGYLHNSDGARALAESWFAEDAPLHNVAVYNEQQLKCFMFLAPLFPDFVLSALEKATESPGFIKGNILDFDRAENIVNLLCHIAYEDKYFDRAVNLALKITETEFELGRVRENIIGRISQLFSLYLSGTQATPARRQNFVRQLLEADNPEYKDIIEHIFRSAFNAVNAVSWMSGADFSFGARKRDTGWQPENWQEQLRLSWYMGFLALLEPYLQSNNEEKRSWAKTLIALNFRQLWNSAGCFDALEKLVQNYGRNGAWPEIWQAIKEVIQFDGSRHDKETLQRLKVLEPLAAPVDLHSEIDAYIFTPLSSQIRAEIPPHDYSQTNFEKAENVIAEKVRNLGQQAAGDSEYLSALSEKWLDVRYYSCPLAVFGQGIAQGSAADYMSIFAILVSQINNSKQENINLAAVGGFLGEVYKADRNLYRSMLQFSWQELQQKRYFICLLCSAPIDDWGMRKLLEIAETKEYPASVFCALYYFDLTSLEIQKLALLLNYIEGSLGSEVVILNLLKNIYFKGELGSPLIHTSFRLSGRKALKEVIIRQCNGEKGLNIASFHSIIEDCFSPEAGEAEIADIIGVICDYLGNLNSLRNDWVELIIKLLQSFPEICLEHIFANDGKEKFRIWNLFSDYPLRYLTLNYIPVEKLIMWSNGDEKKLQKLVSGIGIYETVAETADCGNSKLILSVHIKSVLNTAKDKRAITELIFERIWPRVWSDSLANILQKRSEALKELLTYPDAAVRKLVAEKLAKMPEKIAQEREREKEIFNEEAQSFE